MAAQPDAVRDRQIQAQVQAQPQAQSGDGKSSSRTVTDTIIGELLLRADALNDLRQDILYSATVLRAATESMACIGEHEHTIVGYSLVKGIGDGEPIASERFSVGGHEWVSDSCAESSFLSFVLVLVTFVYSVCCRSCCSTLTARRALPQRAIWLLLGYQLQQGVMVGPISKVGGKGKCCTCPSPPAQSQPIMQTVCPSFLTLSLHCQTLLCTS